MAKNALEIIGIPGNIEVIDKQTLDAVGQALVGLSKVRFELVKKTFTSTFVLQFI